LRLANLALLHDAALFYETPVIDSFLMAAAHDFAPPRIAPVMAAAHDFAPPRIAPVIAASIATAPPVVIPPTAGFRLPFGKLTA
jgi:hypothetical protein